VDEKNGFFFQDFFLFGFNSENYRWLNKARVTTPNLSLGQAGKYLAPE
jgi:hypothetical protein